MSAQYAIPAVFMRGGTSRALVFKAEDLPAPGRQRDALLLAAMGSPDEYGRQLDGMGGGLSSLSKVAIVGPSTHPEADIDYVFGQIAIDAPLVQYKGNCGNISSAIGPFAVDEGLIPAHEGENTVRIHHVHSGKIIVARFLVQDGKAAVTGDFRLPGVAGGGAPVKLSFLQPGGGATGSLLPSGQEQDNLTVDDMGQVRVSMVDAANPVVFVAASDFGLRGTEMPDSFDMALLARLESLRVAAACAMGVVQDEQEARQRVRNLPQVCLVAPPQDSVSLSGERITAADAHILARFISAGQPHRATPLTGGMCLAAALSLPGSLPWELATRPAAGDDGLRIAHPSGILQVAARVEPAADEGWHVAETAVYRSARRLMAGLVYAPAQRVHALTAD